MTADEEAQLLALALKFQVSVPKLLVDSALAGGAENAGVIAAARETTITELFAVRRLLAAISNNVNQMTRFAHAESRLADELEVTLRAVRTLGQRTEGVLESFERDRS